MRAGGGLAWRMVIVAVEEEKDTSEGDHNEIQTVRGELITWHGKKTEGKINKKE